jgi:hypothetical protein
MHSGKYKSDGEFDEYADGTCVMGSSYKLAGLNSVKCEQLRTESDTEISYISTSCEILLTPIEMTQNALLENETQTAIINTGPKTSDSMYLSIRKRVGFPYTYDRDNPETLYIHRKIDDKMSDLTQTMEPSETFIFNDVTIKYLEYNNETARIRIIYDDEDNIKEIPITVGFPEKLDSVEISERHNGLWYDPLYNGQGFDLTVNNDKMNLMWYTYDDEGTNHRFYMGTATLEEGIEEFELYYTKNGTPDAPQEATLVNGGKGQLYFIDDNHGVFNYITEEFGRGSIDIVPIATNQHEVSGLWYDPTRNREGYSIQVFPDRNNRCMLFWYTYAGNQRYNKRQMWFMAEGYLNNGKCEDMVVYQTTKGRFMYPSEVVMNQVGVGTLSVNDDGTLAWEYNMTTDYSINGTATRNLARLI